MNLQTKTAIRLEELNSLDDGFVASSEIINFKNELKENYTKKAPHEFYDWVEEYIKEIESVEGK